MTCIQSLSGALLICSLAITGAEAARKSAKPTEPMAQDTSLNNVKDAPQAPSLACEGPFAKDTTHDKLVATFGASGTTEQHSSGSSSVQIADSPGLAAGLGSPMGHSAATSC